MYQDRSSATDLPVFMDSYTASMTYIWLILFSGGIRWGCPVDRLSQRCWSWCANWNVGSKSKSSEWSFERNSSLTFCPSLFQILSKRKLPAVPLISPYWEPHELKPTEIWAVRSLGKTNKIEKQEDTRSCHQIHWRPIRPTKKRWRTGFWIEHDHPTDRQKS